jgi:hypothetical protein
MQRPATWPHRELNKAAQDDWIAKSKRAAEN